MRRILDRARHYELEVLVSLLLALSAILALHRVPRFAFVMWDDDIELYRNPHVLPLSLEALRWMFTDVAQTQRYIPLSWLNWCTLDRLFGMDPYAYHLENVLLHAANAALLFWLIRALLALAERGEATGNGLRRNVAAALGALLWALHPLRVEATAWVTQERFTQSTFFFLIALIAYLHAVGGERPHVRRWAIVVAVVSSAASVLSYGISAPIPLILVVLDVYPLRRLRAGPGGWWTRSARGVFLEKALFAAAPALVGFVTLWARLHPVGIWAPALPLSAFGVFPRVMQAAYVVAYFVFRPLVPVHLSPVYTRLIEFDPLEPVFVLSAAFVIALTLLLFRVRRRRPALLAGWVCHLALMAPTLGFTEHPHYTSDRYSYLAGIVGSVLVAGGLATLWSMKTRAFVAACAAPVVVLCVALGILSARQAMVWRDSESLFRHVLAELGDHPYRAEIDFRLGLAYLDDGRRDEAFDAFRAALSLTPNHRGALANAAALSLDRGKPEDAVRDFTAALRGQENPFYRHGLGLALGAMGRYAEASRELRRAVEEAPALAAAHYDLGRVLLALGDAASARRECDLLAALDPTLARRLLEQLDAPR